MTTEVIEKEVQENKGRLPQGWTKTTVSNLGDIITGTTPSTKNAAYYGSDYPFYKPADLDAGYYTKSAKDNLSNEGIHKARLLKEKSTLVTCIGATIGKTAFIRKEGACNQQVNVIVPSSELIPEFIYFSCISPLFQDLIKSNASSTTLPILNKSKFESLSFLLPPFNEQQRIVNKIEELFSELDKGVKALNDLKKSLKQYRQSVLKHAFNGELTKEWREQNKDKLEPASVLLEKIKAERKEKLGKKYKELPPPDTSELAELPSDWKYTTLASICDVVSGGTPSTKDESNFGGDIAWLTPADLSNYTNKFIEKGKRNITDKGLNSSSATLMPKGSILFSSRAPIGYTVIASNEISTNQGFKNLVPTELVFNEYIYYYLKGNKNLAEKYSSGTTFREISGTSFGKLPFAICSIKEQQKIVEEIERHFSIADAVEKSVEESLKQSERLRQSILKQAFEGKLVPQDPTDEPASELLKRIKAEKEAMKKAKKVKKK